MRGIKRRLMIAVLLATCVGVADQAVAADEPAEQTTEKADVVTSEEITASIRPGTKQHEWLLRVNGGTDVAVEIPDCDGRVTEIAASSWDSDTGVVVAVEFMVDERTWSYAWITMTGSVKEDKWFAPATRRFHVSEVDYDLFVRGGRGDSIYVLMTRYTRKRARKFGAVEGIAYVDSCPRVTGLISGEVTPIGGVE